MWANNFPRHRSKLPPHRSLPTATPNRHVTTETARVRHITAADDPHPPPYHPKAACTGGHVMDDDDWLKRHEEQEEVEEEWRGRMEWEEMNEGE